MIAAPPIALLVLAQAAAATPAPAKDQSNAAAEPAPAQPDCKSPGADTRVIVICAQKPQGYRLNPDVMEARRETRSAGRPTSPYQQLRPDCASVGPAPCVSAGISLIGVALTAAEMAKRLAEGKEVGSMFKTDPHPSEYQLYQMAKARREAEEAEKAAIAKAKAAAAKAAAAQSATAPPR